MNYYLWTIGCQMNFADSRRLADDLERLGYRPADCPENADLILLNTCVVRQNAEDKVLGRLTSLQGLKRRRPELGLAVMGCFVDARAWATRPRGSGDGAPRFYGDGQAGAGEVSALQQRYPWVDAFIKPSDRDAVLDFARKLAGKQEADGSKPKAAPSQASGRLPPVSVGVPISYGCDHSCTYCIVRLRRGPQVSRSADAIVSEVRELAGQGVKEVILLGQNVDSYGRDLTAVASTPSGEEVEGGRRPVLADLLEAVHGVEGLERIRFLTSHPADMTDCLIETVARLPRVCEQIELPVQSGDDSVLRRMGRGYTTSQYRDLVARIRRAMPGVGLATDVIVGFPGETAAQFEATYRLLEELRFDMVHVAAYSPRPGTPAERLADDVPAAEKERRRRAVDDLQRRVVAEINGLLLGQSVEVLVEGQHQGKWRGRTRTNKLVFFEGGDRDWIGRLVGVRITRTGPWSMQGVVEEL